MENIKSSFYNKNPLMVLSYLTKNVTKPNISSHIAKDLDIATGSVHQILKYFSNINLVKGSQFGKSNVYEIDRESPLIRTFRLFDTLLELYPLIKSLEKKSRKIILYGSCATGTDTELSDIDIMIEADEDNKDLVYRSISDFGYEREINAIVLDTNEVIELEKNEPVFFKEIQKGIEIWGGNNGSN